MARKNKKQKTLIKPVSEEVKPVTKLQRFLHFARIPLWFLLGAFLGAFFFISFICIYFVHSHQRVIYPGVVVNGVDVGGKSPQLIKLLFAEKNKRIHASSFTFVGEDISATISAQSLNLGYDEDLIAKQAYSIGRSPNVISNISLIFQAYTHGITIQAPIHYNDDKLTTVLAPMQEKLTITPINGRFTFENGRVTEFQESKDGQEIDLKQLKTSLKNKALAIAPLARPQHIQMPVPIHVLKPAVTTDKINNLGIKEIVGQGTSLFHGSAPERIFNITLAASRLNGVLIPPNTTFSFDKAVGDISSLSGYKQAYVIQNGKTVLGDGGGVCQVSTTFFRAILHAGYPIVERNAHAYRVHYYEEDSGPGIDAAIYTPTVDLKFKNESGHYLLVQAAVDPQEERLTFSLYGTKDNREVTMTDPVVLSRTPAPAPLYQDDPTLPKGVVKQVDFSADGANVYFTRTVSQNGKVIINEKFTSNYRPWQAIFLRGTK